MSEKEYDLFFELLEQIVGGSNGGTWQERRDVLLSHASEHDQTNLGELAGWFE